MGNGIGAVNVRLRMYLTLQDAVKKQYCEEISAVTKS